MAWFKKNNLKVDERADSLLGSGASMEGTIDTEGSLRIDGRFKGVVKAAGDIVIAENAEVEANLNGYNILIAGTVHGEVRAEGKLEITPKGRLYGNFQAIKLLIEEGALIRGKCQMDSAARPGENQGLSAADPSDNKDQVSSE